MNDPAHRVRIFDTSLRDGEQSPGCSMTAPQKLRFAHALAELGVDVIEAGFPASSEADRDAVRAIAREVRGATVATLARCHAGGESINAWMVREGWATAYLRYSVAYRPEQIVAWWHGSGLWAGSFEAPEDHRRRR